MPVDGRRAANTKVRHAAVHELKARGMSHRAPEPAQRTRLLAAFKPHLHDRLEQDPTVATDVLLAELCEHGYRGSHRTLRRYLSQARRMQPAAAPPPAVPSARQITGWITPPDDKLDEADRLGSKDHLCGGARSWPRSPSWRTGSPNWSAPAAVPAWSGPYSDFDAVKAGLTLQWSSGKVEGTNTRVKMIKRQMCGRANLDLLRRRLLAPP